MHKLGYHRVLLFETMLERPVPSTRSLVPLDFGFADLEAVDELAALRHLPSETIRDRFLRGERCFIARSKGRIVAAYWAHRFDVELPGVRRTVAVADDVIYGGDLWVAEDARGLGVAPAANQAFKDQLGSEGYARLIFYVLAGNRLGLANARHGQARVTARYAAWQVWRLPAVPMPFLE